jgi:3-oxoacyl-[acyl-carrier protein] reductase
MSAAELDGVRAVVTGSTRGLGAAIARDLSARGAGVVVNGTDRERVRALAGELGSPVVVGSVADEAIAEALVERCVAEFGGIDLLVNNAGITRDAALVKASVDDLDAVLAVHVRGTWLTSRAAARAMRGQGGTIVNVISGTALYGNAGQSAYAAAKGGILALTRALALELRRLAIRVNAISPVVRTDMIAPLLEFAPELAPSLGAAEDVAPLVALLASPAAAKLSGIVLGFDGRQLTAWSHPAAQATVKVTDSHDLAVLSDALQRLPHPTANPDEFGQGVFRALGVDPL